MDVRPGGVWRFVMHGPDGVDYKNKIVYTEVVKPERLAYAHGFDDDGATEGFDAVVAFEDLGGKTKLTLRMVFRTAAQRRQMLDDYGALEGANQTVDRLAEHLSGGVKG